jgi:hypothetical protein
LPVGGQQFFLQLTYPRSASHIQGKNNPVSTEIFPAHFITQGCSFAASLPCGWRLKPQMSTFSPRFHLSCYFIAAIVLFTDSIKASPDCSFNASYPRSYVALATNSSPVIDGQIDDEFWRATPWTEAFVDISTETPPHLVTRAKIRWDKEWL